MDPEKADFRWVREKRFPLEHCLAPACSALEPPDWMSWGRVATVRDANGHS